MRVQSLAHYHPGHTATPPKIGGELKRSMRFLMVIALLLAPVPAWAFDLKQLDNNPLLEIVLIMSAFTLIPAVLVMFTSFTRVVIVLSFLRQAIGGGQQIPPNPVIIGLSLFLTLFIMAPAVDTITKEALNPYLAKQITFSEAVDKAVPPVRTFMLKQTRPKDMELFLSIAKKEKPKKAEDLPLSILVPAFSISELKTAFEIGFLIYLPFLVVDMVVSSILLSMGMMMLPPAAIALPFKLLLFVMADGWNLVVGSVVRSFQ